MTEPTTTPTIPSRVQTITELFTTNLPRLEKGQAVGKEMLTELQGSKITNDIERETFVNRMVKIRQVYEKVKAIRMEITRPLDELKEQMMSFEREMDDTSKTNAFAQAKQIIQAYDQAKVNAAKVKEAEAEVLKQTTIYKAELNAAVGRACIEMLAGQTRNLIAGMSKWEAEMTLENFAENEKKINSDTNPQLKIEKYDACFNLNFTKKLLNEEETKSFIEGLKLIYPYDLYNKKYVQFVAELKNDYRAKLPSIKAQLIEAKTSKEAEEKRQAEIKAKEQEALKASEDQANKEVQEVVNQKDLTTVEADFVKQGQMDGVEAGPMKKVASFVDDALWIKPFIGIVTVVAGSGISIKNPKGAYIPAVQWWLTKAESLNKPVEGILLTDVAKTILKEKKGEDA